MLTLFSNWRRITIYIALLIALILGLYVALTQPETANLDQFASLKDKYQVEILRDKWGVPHVFGKTDADTAFGIAYAHAEDDFATLQGVLAAARGDLALFTGPKGAGNDFMVALLRHWRKIRFRYNKDLSPETRALAQGYADGLNYYASRQQEEAWAALYPVRGQDVVAGFVHKVPLFYGFEKTLAKLFEAGKRPKLTQDSQEPQKQSFDNKRKIPEKYELALLSDNYLARSLRQSSVFQSHASNTLAVSPRRSQNGQTFLDINSHQPWKGPVSWYEVHAHSQEGWDAVGGLFPGSPVILHGHNRRLGWAHTVNKPDLYDVYTLDINPNNPLQYKFDGEWRTLTERTIKIKVKIWGPLYWTAERKVYWSVYGPTVKLDHGTYAFRYASMNDIRQLEQWYRMNKSRNFREWQQAMRLRSIPCFNVGYADKEGNIYYLYNARIPKRSPEYNWQGYVPGNTSKTLWQDYISFDKQPQVLNPDSGFVQNCNSNPFKTTLGRDNPNPEDYGPTLGIERYMTNRAVRARELFSADPSVTFAEFKRYKYDMNYSDKSLMAQYQNLLATFDLSKLLQKIKKLPDETTLQSKDKKLIRRAHKILLEWDLSTTPENRHTALSMLTLRRWYIDKKKTFSAKLYFAKLLRAADILLQHHGTLTPPWRQVNRLIRGDTDLGLGGGFDVLHAIHGDLTDNGRIKAHVGDSYVLLVQWDRQGRVSSRSIHQFGSATQDKSSPHYDDQAKLFAERKLKPVWLDKNKILQNLERRYRPGEKR